MFSVGNVPQWSNNKYSTQYNTAVECQSGQDSTVEGVYSRVWQVEDGRPKLASPVEGICTGHYKENLYITLSLPLITSQHS